MQSDCNVPCRNIQSQLQKLGRCVKHKLKQNAMICKSHKPIFYSQLNIKTDVEIENILPFHGKYQLILMAATHLKKVRTEATKGWKSNWYK